MEGVRQLATVSEAVRVLGLSREFIYRLPPGTPGILRFGRAVRIDIAALKSWASSQAASGPGSDR